MSSGMNMEEAEKIADKMSYREAIMNCLYARCVPYRKATKIKMKRLLKSIDALDIDMDKPMHFTPEQKAWVKKYLSINGERQRLDGAREFAEWLQENVFISGETIVCGKEFTRVVGFLELYAKWQKKGKENE